MNRLFRNTLQPWLHKSLEDTLDEVLQTNLSDIFGFHGQTPAVNIVEDDKSFDIQVAAPGHDKSDFKIEIQDQQLIIEVAKEAKQQEEGQQKSWTKKEFKVQNFHRKFSLSDQVDADNISANYENGILHISVPKKEIHTISRKIEVQ